MSIVDIDLDAASTAVDEVSGRVAGVLSSIGDTSVPVPLLEWTAGETAAHLVTSTRWFDDYATGRRKPPVTTLQVPAFNAQRIADFPERDGRRLATHLREAVGTYLATVREHRADDPFLWFDDYIVGVDEGTCILLGELVVHGLDIARAVEQPWPISPDHARLILAGSLPVLPLYVDDVVAQHFHANYEIKIKGSDPFYLGFDNGTLHVTASSSEPIDCRINADPIAYLLVSYGRISPLSAIARGQLISWGRKPWLGTKFPKLLRKP